MDSDISLNLLIRCGGSEKSRFGVDTVCCIQMKQLKLSLHGYDGPAGCPLA